MPWTTQQIYLLTIFLTDPWVVTLCLLLTPPALYQLRAFWRSRQGRYLRDFLMLKTPVLSSLHRSAASARFCRGASLLLGCGLNMLQSIELLQGMVGSPVLEAALRESGRRIRDEGSSFSQEIFRMKFLPSYCGYLVAVGEEVGQTGQILGRLALNLEEEVDLLAIQALNLLEPIMLAIMGVAVAFVLWSVFVPIYKLVEVL